MTKSTAHPQRLNSLNRKDFQAIQGLCFDIDDTFSTHGKITAEAFSALWALKSAGYALIPITGRPAGWCDHIARFWPVDAVVGENGAFSLFMAEGKLQRLNTLSDADTLQAKIKLATLKAQIQSEFPHAKFASDQLYREFDLAIDFCEDVSPWPESEVKRLISFCESQGAVAKLSSIHVNTWFGDYTKVNGLKTLLSKSEQDQIPLKLPKQNEMFYIGDSPNDEPMFEVFEHSFGVANIQPFLAKLNTQPRYLTQFEAGAGFAELAKFLQT